ASRRTSGVHTVMAQVTIDEAMRIAIGHHQGGRMAEAEAICRQILDQVPNHADALHLLGALACRMGRNDLAIELLGRAIALRPDPAEPRANLGNALTAAGRPDEAIAACTRAIQLKPDLAEAHGSLGNALKDKGRLDEAIAAYGRAIQLRPGYASAHTN